MTIGVLLLFIIIIVLILIKNKGKNIPKKDEKKVEVALDNTLSGTYFSDDFLKKEPITTYDKDHVITTIYVEKEDKFIWICPNCEVENLSSKKKCCVCNYIKNGEDICIVKNVDAG